MIIGIVPDPIQHPDWPKMEAYLRPAADRGKQSEVLPEGQLVWAVYDGLQLTGCATARLTVDGFGEVVLVGGKDARRWIGELDAMIGRWMRDEGMTSIRAYGRKGWTPLLCKQGWLVTGSQCNMTQYERPI